MTSLHLMHISHRARHQRRAICKFHASTSRHRSLTSKLRLVGISSHEWNEAVAWCSLTQERMLEQLEGRGTLGGIAHQHPIQKSLQTWRHLTTNQRTITVLSLSSPLRSTNNINCITPATEHGPVGVPNNIKFDTKRERNEMESKRRNSINMGGGRNYHCKNYQEHRLIVRM